MIIQVRNHDNSLWSGVCVLTGHTLVIEIKEK